MDPNIIRALEAGDPRSLEWIFTTYGQDCIRRLQRHEHCSPEDAEDILMDALLIYWQQVRQGKVRELNRSRAYLYSICVNQQRQRYRQQQQDRDTRTLIRHQHEQAYELPWVDERIQKETRAEQWATVQTALHQLGDRCQRVIRYFYVQKLPPAGDRAAARSSQRRRG